MSAAPAALPPDPSAPLLHLHEVHKSLGGRAVLQGLSLTLRRGEVYGLLGPNGSGKSTAIRLMAGLLVPDAGRVTLEGRPAAERAPTRLGLCPQEVSLYRDLTVEENLDFFARLHGGSRRARAARVLDLVERFDLGPYRRERVARLSGGWQQRVNLAVAMVHAPPLLVLDEPTSAVDVEARHGLWRLLERLHGAGTTMLLTTHHLDEAERLCTRIGLIDGGRLIAEGTVAQLLARVPARAVAEVLCDDEPALAERASRLGWTSRRHAGRPVCLLPELLSLREVVEALDGLPVRSVAVQPLRLEHAYLDLLEASRPAQAAGTASITA